MTAARPTRDGGFTLVEVLVSVIVTAMILVAAAGVLVLAQRTLQITGESAVLSRNSQLATLWLVRDVRSAVVVDTPACDGSNPDGFQVLALESSDPAGGTSSSISYRLEGGSMVRYAHGSSDGVPSVVTVADRLAAACAVQDGQAVRVALESTLGSRFDLTVVATRSVQS